MSRVLILGAGGFIGYKVGRLLRTEGYTVRGLVRSEEAAKKLQKGEIIPIIGDARDLKTWEYAADESDVIIATVVDRADMTAEVDINTALISYATKEPKKLFIFTSGMIAYGHTGDRTATESDKVNPPAWTKARDDSEKLILALGGISLRVAAVYGEISNALHSFFQAASTTEDKVLFYGTSDDFFPTIHIDDVASAYVAVVKNGKSLRGEIFNVTAYNERKTSILNAVLGYLKVHKSIEFGPGKDPWSSIFMNSVKLSSDKLKLVTGWYPKQKPVADGIEIYYPAWKASLNK